jgi:hypothetical protein
MGEQRTVNKGITMARGGYICVVNSDDPILPGLLSTSVDALETDREALVAYPDWLEIGPDSGPLTAYGLPLYDIGRMLREFNVSMGPGALIRRCTFELIGLRDEQRRFTGDLEFWFRVALHGKMLHLPEILATHRTHPGGAQVTIRQREIATELLSIVDQCLASPLLPPALRAENRNLIANACEAILKQCGADSAVWRFVWDRLIHEQPLFLFGLYARQIHDVLRRRLQQWKTRN